MLREKYRPVVLCYHRISEYETKDLNKLSVTPENFRAQLKRLRKTRTFVSIDELINNAEPNSVSVTFDDGYLDNYEIAASILVEENIPAAFYVSTRFIQERRHFYTTSLDGLFARDPHLLRLLANDYLRLGEDRIKTITYQDLLRKVSTLPISELWELTCILDDAYCNLELSDDFVRPMTPNEVLFLHNHHLFTIGPHTATHPRLSGRAIREVVDDVAESISSIVDWLGEGSSVSSFPHPFGQKADFTGRLNERLMELFDLKAMSTIPRSVQRTDLGRKSAAIPRLSVQNWSEDTFMRVIHLMEAFSYAPFILDSALFVRRGLARFS